MGLRWETGVPRKMILREVRTALLVNGDRHALDNQGIVYFFSCLSLRLCVKLLYGPAAVSVAGSLNKNYALVDIYL